MNRGIIYCASNQRYFELATLSAKIAQHYCDLPYSVLADKKYDSHCLHCPSNSNGRLIKTNMALLTPYEETLYLDCDILVQADFSAIWSYLPLGLALSKQNIANAPASRQETNETLGLIRYNSGVICFNKQHFSKVQWSREWSKYKGIDELALARCRPDVNILPEKFNSPDGSAVLKHVHTSEHGLDKIQDMFSNR